MQHLWGTKGKDKAGARLPGKANVLLLCSSQGIHFVLSSGGLSLKKTNLGSFCFEGVQ